MPLLITNKEYSNYSEACEATGTIDGDIIIILPEKNGFVDVQGRIKYLNARIACYDK